MTYKKLQILNNICADTYVMCGILKKYIHKGLYMHESNESKCFKVKDIEVCNDYLAFRYKKHNDGISTFYVIPLKHISDGSTIFVIEKDEI